MRLLCKLMIAISLVTVPICGAFAQANKSHHQASHHLTKNDRKSLVAVALSERVQQEEDESDCSHLVHAIYETAGFPYEYAPSDDLYVGVHSFERVKAPLPGDLIVWRGHVGMVIKPSKHSFFSSLSSGPGTDDYKSAYWKRRGLPRFYRYIKKESAHKCELNVSRPQPKAVAFSGISLVIFGRNSTQIKPLQNFHTAVWANCYRDTRIC